MTARPSRQLSIAGWIAVLIAALTVGLTIRFNTFAPWGSDQAGYIEAAERWANGRLMEPLPQQLWTATPLADHLISPFGLRPSRIRGTDASIFPLGYPVIMAAAIRIGGELAAYLVTPLAAGVLILCTYQLASGVAGPWAGAMGAALMAATPVMLFYSVQPMSDVPATALWALAWVMSLRSGLGASAASGSAVALAVMVRPNLAPLALVLAAVRASAAVSREGRWRSLAVFGALAAIGPVVLAWSQAELYGSPFRSGYLLRDTFFQLAHVPRNLVIYPRLLTVVHTPLIFVGLVAPLAMLSARVRAAMDARARAAIVSAVFIAAVTYALYLPYLPYDDVFYLRFMLPAICALFVLLASVLVLLGRLVAARARLLAPLMLVPAALVAVHPAGVRYAFTIHQHQARVRAMGNYLRQALPANAAVIVGGQSCAIAYYTGRVVVRLDVIAGLALHDITDDLRRRGLRPVFVLDDGGDRAQFKAAFATRPFQDLDWPPRAVFKDHSSLVYFDPSDRGSGATWPVDVLSTLR